MNDTNLTPLSEFCLAAFAFFIFLARGNTNPDFKWPGCGPRWFEGEQR